MLSLLLSLGEIWLTLGNLTNGIIIQGNSNGSMIYLVEIWLTLGNITNGIVIQGKGNGSMIYLEPGRNMVNIGESNKWNRHTGKK